MIILALLVTSDLKNHGTQTIATPPDCTELLGIVTFLVNQVNLIENLPRLVQADAVLCLTVRLFNLSKSKRIDIYNSYIIGPPALRGRFLA